MKKSIGAKTLALAAPVWIVGSYDREGKPNMMAVAWGGICCSQPACLTVSIRKATYTYGCILERQAYTVSVPSEAHVKEADYAGIASGREADKFAKTGLTAVKSDLVDAPYIKEFPLILECKLLKTVELGLHTQFIGEIVDVKADEEVLNERNYPVMAKVKPILFGTGDRKYHGIGPLLGDAYSVGKTLL